MEGNPVTKPNWILFLGALLVAIGPWGFENVGVWSDLIMPGKMFSLLGIVGGVILAWLGQSPVKKP